MTAFSFRLFDNDATAPTPDREYASAMSDMHNIWDEGGQPGNPDHLYAALRPASWFTRVGNALGAVAPYVRPPEDTVPRPSPMIGRNGGGMSYRGPQWQAPQAPDLNRRQTYALGDRLGYRFAEGGQLPDAALIARWAAAGGGRPPAEQVPGYATSPNLYRGPGGGQSDGLPARVSPGEYIFSARDVALLGDGNNEEGARRLDEMREQVRGHMMTKGHPPMAKTPLQYLKKGSR